MAFIHTNFLTGNDTTGNGSTATPYKTVFKALEVAVSSDFIKVAGGQWSSNLAGTFTFTFNTNVVTTSVSQVGTVLVDDILSFEDGQFGFDRFHVKVLAVTTSTITTQLIWGMDTVTVSGVKRIETYHYSTSGATAFETQTTTGINPGGRTGITVSGGWSNDFATQSGWTVVRRTGVPITQSPGPTLFALSATNGGLGDWKQNLIFDKFLFENAVMFSMSGATAVNSGNSFSLGELAFVRSRFSFQLNQANAFGIWQSDPLVPIKFYITCPDATAGNDASINSPGNANRPEAAKFELWNTFAGNSINSVASGIWGFGMLSPTGLDGSINQLTLHYRSNYLEGVSASQDGSGTNSSTWGNNGGYYDEVNFYCNRPTFFNILVGTGVFQYDSINLLGPYANQSTLTIAPQAVVNYQIITNLATQTVDSIKPGYTRLGVQGGLSTVGSFNRITQGQPSIVTVVDSEGLKTLDIYNNVYFKDNGNLKVSSSYSFSINSSPYDVPKLIGVFEKPLVEFTVSFTLKVDAGAEGKWTKLLVQYGPNVNQVIEQALSPTDTFATYTMTIDPANYGDWTKFQFPIYLGIQARSANSYLGEAMTYCYIQSITVA